MLYLIICINNKVREVYQNKKPNEIKNRAENMKKTRLVSLFQLLFVIGLFDCCDAEALPKFCGLASFNANEFTPGHLAEGNCIDA